MDLYRVCLCFSVFTLSTAVRHNAGLEFIVGFLENEPTGSSLDLEIFVTTKSNMAANVTVTAPLYDSTFIREAVVNRGGISKLTVPAALRGSGSSRSNKGILIQSTEEITVYCVNKEIYSTDAFIALPVEALGYKYYVLTYKTEPTMLFVGTEDNTDVFITLPSPAQQINIVFEGVTYLSGDVLKLRINRFQAVHLFQSTANADFTGTFIDANKPVALFSGNRKVPVPVATGSGDHIVEQMTPINTWGKEFVFVSTPDRTTGDSIRIVAAEDTTIVTISSIGSITISFAGEIIELEIPSSEVRYISAFKPIMVGVFSETDPGSEVNGGDPSLYLLTPISQYAPDYVFSTVETPTGEFTNYLTLVVKDTEKAGLKLDNSAVTGITWVIVPDSNGLVAGTVGIAPGSHEVHHDNPTVVFSALCTGVADYNSYAFSSGLRLATINEACSATASVAGDVVDNDCDGLIDEEENNGIDDDGDGSVDEDLSLPRRVEGGLSTWTAWSSCTVTCGGNGTVTRNRKCDSPTLAHNGLPCSDALIETVVCLPVVEDCPIDGNWATWTGWSACSVTCGSGNETRSRSCTNPAPQFNGSSCAGDGEEVRICNTGVPCPVDGVWSSWVAWSSCSVTCGIGSRDRSRSCDNPAAAHGGLDCAGAENETEACDTAVNCPVDGGFTTWTVWSPCVVTCGNGTQTRTRSCTNPTPQHGGNNCTGDSDETMDCDTGIRCPLPGGWGSWNVMSACSLSCGGGYRVRNRPCNNPVPEPGADCPGISFEMEACNSQVCQSTDANLSCAYRWFPCRDGSACLPPFSRCNCHIDCADGSDEISYYARCVNDIDQCEPPESEASQIEEPLMSLFLYFVVLIHMYII